MEENFTCAKLICVKSYVQGAPSSDNEKKSTSKISMTYRANNSISGNQHDPSILKHMW